MKKLTVLLLIAIFFGAAGFSQEGVVKTSYTKDSVVTFRVFDTKIRKIDASKSKEAIKDLIKADKDDDLKEHQSPPDELGYIHYFYQQTYKGINVENGMYIAHIKDGLVESVNGDFLNVGMVDVNATLSESEALAKALDSIGAKTYKWQIKEEEQFIKELKNDNNATYFPKGEKVIAYNNVTKIYRLAYKFNIYAHYPLSRNNVFIDAITGDLLGKQNLIFDANATGSADTRYSGNQAIITDSNSGTFRLRELTNSVRIETYNMRGRTSYSGSPDFNDNNNSWTATEYHTNLDDAALDAHWGAERVYAYWNSVRGVNSWNGSGAPLLNYVHADLPSINPNLYSDNDNALWDGDRMVYADGQTAFNAVVSLDVVAHEIGHAFCQGVMFMRTPNLTTRILSDQFQPESLALNEGMSDIWAACVEQWAAPAKEHWQVGEEIMRNGFSCLRSLRSPKTEGFRGGFPTEGNYPDTYGRTNWYSGASLGIFSHTNATVLSHWFYLLTIGGSGTNDIGNTYNITGIGITDAASIAWRAERFKFTASTNFASARDLLIQAATELYTANSCQVKAVTDAWYAAGVGSPFQYTNVNVSGPTSVCSTGSTFTVNNVPAGCTVRWACSTNISFDNQTGNPKVFTATVNSTGWIQAIIVSTGCGDNTLPALQVHTGPYSSSDYPISGPSSVPCRQYAYYSIPTLSGASSINWVWPSGWTYVSGQNTPYLALQTGTLGGTIAVGVYNSCGQTGSYATKYISVFGFCGYSLSVSPNPASGETTIELMNADPEKQASTVEWELEVYDQLQVQKTKTPKLKDKTYKLNTQGWKDGVYIILAKVGDESISEKLVVKH